MSTEPRGIILIKQALTGSEKVAFYHLTTAFFLMIGISLINVLYQQAEQKATKQTYSVLVKQMTAIQTDFDTANRKKFTLLISRTFFPVIKVARIYFTSNLSTDNKLSS